MNNMPKGLRLVVTIVDRKKGKKIIKLYEKIGCTNHQTFLGKGTAPIEVFDLLGFGRVEKEVILSIVDEQLVPKMFEELKQKMHFDEPGHGVAWSIEVCSAGGTRTMKEIMGTFVKE